MKVTIVGAGYVGLVTGACLADLGHSVVCVDHNTDRVEAINGGRAPFFEPGLMELVARNTRSGHLAAVTRLEDAVPGANLIFIAVGTPTVRGAIDVSQVVSVATRLGQILGAAVVDHPIVVKSTVVPGTTEGIVRDAVAAAAGVDKAYVLVAANPEFMRQGSAVEDFMQPDRIVVGASSPDVAARVIALYDTLDSAKIVTTSTNAELIKYATNTFLATVISFSNEIANICETIPGADVATVMEGVHLDKRLTLRSAQNVVSAGIIAYLRAGCGFGGSCLPKDIRALIRYSEDRHVRSALFRAVIDVNEDRPRRLVEKVRARLGDLEGRTVLVIGIAFKAGTDDLRDSPALVVIKELAGLGARILAWDPHVPASQLPAIGNISKVDDLAAAVGECDAAIITSAFSELAERNWRSMLEQSHCKVIVDGRGILARADLPGSIAYDVVGRHQADTIHRTGIC